MKNSTKIIPGKKAMKMVFTAVFSLLLFVVSARAQSLNVYNEDDCPDMDITFSNCSPSVYPLTNGSWGSPGLTSLSSLDPNCFTGNATIHCGSSSLTFSSSSTCITTGPKGCLVGSVCCSGVNCIPNNCVEVWLTIDPLGNWILKLSRPRSCH